MVVFSSLAFAAVEQNFSFLIAGALVLFLTFSWPTSCCQTGFYLNNYLITAGLAGNQSCD